MFLDTSDTVSEPETQQDTLEHKIDQLEFENYKLRLELNNLKKESDQAKTFFTKYKRSFSTELRTLILKLYGDGLNASQIHKTLNRMKNCLEILDGFKIPSLTYINSLRLSMQKLNELKAIQFVEKSKMLTLSMDESPTSSGDKAFQIGVYNEHGEYCVLSFKEIAGGTADEIHDRVSQLLQDLFEEKFVQFISKIRFLSSDSARNQIAANKKLISTFMRLNGGKVIFLIKCSMHCISNMEKYAKKSNETLNEVLNAISNGLGTRSKQGKDSFETVTIGTVTIGTVTIETVTIGTVTIGIVTIGTVTIGTVTIGTVD